MQHLVTLAAKKKSLKIGADSLCDLLIAGRLQYIQIVIYIQYLVWNRKKNCCVAAEMRHPPPEEIRQCVWW